MLAGYRFDGRFVFDGDRLLSHELALHDPATKLFSLLNSLNIAHDTRRRPLPCSPSRKRSATGRQTSGART